MTIHGVRLCDKCDRLVGLAKRAKAARIKAKILPASVLRHKQAKRDGEDAREAEDAARREAVMNRPGPACELGNHDVVPGTVVDIHHLEPGAKRRNGTVKNMLRACRDCHEGYHRCPTKYVPAVREWCARHGYQLPNRKEYR